MELTMPRRGSTGYVVLAIGFCLLVVVIYFTETTTFGIIKLEEVEKELDDFKEKKENLQKLLKTQNNDESTVVSNNTAIKDDIKPIIKESGDKCIWKPRKNEKPGYDIRTSPPIQYIHIPKAGGTTIQDELTIFARRSGIAVHLHNAGGPLWDASTKAKGLYLGHRGYGFSKTFKQITSNNDVKPVYIVTVREPISRLISLFDYIMRTNAPQFVEMHKWWRDVSLDEIVNKFHEAVKSGAKPMGQGIDVDQEIVAFYRLLNQQVDYLCGFECVFLPYDDNTAAEFATTLAATLTEEQKFKRAMGNLKQVDCVAVIERFNDLIPQMKSHIDWIPSSYNKFPKENKSTEEPSTLTEENKEILKSYMKYEFEIYSEAKKINEEKMKCLSQL